MNVRRITCISGALALLLVVTNGCVSKAIYDRCKNQNLTVQEKLSQLMDQQASWADQTKACQSKYDSVMAMLNAAREANTALQNSLLGKQDLIKQLSEQVGKPALPIALSNALAEWAQKSGSDMVTYDAENGVVRFKSDLVFKSGSDVVQPDAQEQINLLSGILNSAIAEGFDIKVVGHTDDQPIKYSIAKHPTNWHLSAHRAIAVERILASGGNLESHITIEGKGEFSPIEPNVPNKGNAKNRRVEIFILPTR
ncbi:MAG: OmpA family protein [Phycisphaerae bacterium]|nr:OmpA family protein [Phycisphaerae bacterium]